MAGSPHDAAKGAGRAHGRRLEAACLRTVFACLILATPLGHAANYVVWHPPEFAKPKAEYPAAYPLDQLQWLAVGAPEEARPKAVLWDHTLPPWPTDGLQRAEVAYAAGVELEQLSSPRCLEFYYLAIWNVWPHVPPDPRSAPPAACRAWNVYHSSVARFLQQAQRHRRWDPEQGIRLATPLGAIWVQTRLTGFLWQPKDFREIELVGEYASPPLQVRYATPGIGVPLVVKRPGTPEDPFLSHDVKFSATALLIPHRDDIRVSPSGDGNATHIATLELFEPRRTTHVTLDAGRVPLARDLSASIAWALKESQQCRIGRAGGALDQLQAASQLQRLTQVRARLWMLEPHRRGKIPVVFVHGLFSNRLAWANVVNELDVLPDIERHFEFWVFEYDTSKNFLVTASLLRQQLYEITSRLDPQGYDPGLNRLVLIGHSMGGLISKLQVTSSGDRLWNVAARVPIQTVQMDEETRHAFEGAFFFEPVPFVRRVIYVGTPHRGSPYAGRIASLCISATDRHSEAAKEYRRVIAANPGVFKKEFRHRPPNSIDMLTPKSSLLQAIERLPRSPHVRFHSIIGTAHSIPGYGAGDGVVPVLSARVLPVTSECYVPALHTELLLPRQTTQEIARILREHLREAGL